MLSREVARLRSCELRSGWYRLCAGRRLYHNQQIEEHHRDGPEHSTGGESSATANVYERYAQKLEAKAKEKGYRDFDELKAKTFRPRHGPSGKVPRNPPIGSPARQSTETQLLKPSNLEGAGPQQQKSLPSRITQLGGPAQTVKPVKTLEDIMDLGKIRSRDAKAIGAIWTAHNTGKGHLAAVIPKAVYERLLSNAKKYPMFVLPLSRVEAGTAQEAVEMHILQWSFFDNKQSHVIFTSLGEYKLRTDYAQPHLTLSHYTELMESKGIVLMKGEFDADKGILQPHQAQWLAFALQQFYVTGGTSKMELLRTFHEKPSDFDYRALIEEAGRFTTSQSATPPARPDRPFQSRSFSTSARLPARYTSPAFIARRSYVSSGDQQGLRNRAFVGPFTFRAGGLFVVTALGLYFYFQNEKAKVDRKRLEAKQSLSAGRAKIGGPFSLTDQHGRPFSDKDLLGKFSLIYFGFTRCPDICPLEIDKMGQVVDDLDKQFQKETVLPVFVTCDPARDGVEDVKQYIDEFHPRLVGLTGSFEEIKSACRQYRVYFSSPPNVKPGEDYLVDHSIFFYLMDPKGQFVDAFGRQFTREDVTAKIAKYMQEWETAGQIAPGQNILR